MRSSIVLTVFSLAIAGCGEYSRWQHCYSTEWWSWQNALAHIEGVHFDSLCRGRAVSAAARENAQKKIEKFLGRKMRTEEEWLRAHEEEWKKMRAARDGKIGPDLKKLRPAACLPK